MSDSQWWLTAVLDERDDLVAFVLVVGVLALRLLPATRRWAPRGNARPARPDTTPMPAHVAGPRATPSTQSTRSRLTAVGR
jgi:hypothetical protein